MISKRIARSARILAIATVATSAEAAAQTCLGRPAEGPRHFNVGASLQFARSAHYVGASLVPVGERVFAGAVVGTVSYKDFTGSSTHFGGFIGRKMRAGATGRGQICPSLAIDAGFGPNNLDGSGIFVRSSGFSAGLDLGVLTRDTPRVRVAPSFGFSVGRSKVTFSDGFNSISDAETSAAVSFGVGVTLRGKFNLLPSVALPIGEEDIRPTLSLSFSLLVPTTP